MELKVTFCFLRRCPSQLNFVRALFLAATSIFQSVCRTGPSFWSKRVELRSAVRYPVKASVVFTWQGPDGRLQGEGVTRDISRTGVYVRTSTSPPLAVAVQMEIFLPPIEPEGKAMKVLSEGPVIRVEKQSANEAQGGFAVFTLLKVAPLADGK